MRRIELKSVMVQSALFAVLFIPMFAFAQTTTVSTGFVPLTHFPQIQSLSQSQGFGDFVNTFYKILIGAGAVLAVIMIMVAGAQFMTSRGSVASNEKAKSRIQNALLGLLLVLAPTIVFGIINPSILKLNLGTEFGGLQQQKINQDVFSSSPNPALSAQQCSSIKNKALVPITSGQSAVSVCSAKGSGWASYDTQCCSSNDSSQACCGYDPANIGTQTAPSNPDNGTGNFSYDYVLQETDLNTGAACTAGVQTRRFSTSAECNASAQSAGSDTAVRNRCSGTETYIPSQTRFNQINSLPTCSP